MSDLIAFIEARLAEDERIAVEASRDRDDHTPTGEHWHWECDNCDTPIEITDVVVMDEFLECPSCGSVGVGLRSIEEYPTGYGGRPLAHLVTHSCEEMRPVDGLHIVRHDPARALREVEAKRAIKDWCARMDPPYGLGGILAGEARRILRWLAAVWSEHPDYRAEWRVA